MFRKKKSKDEKKELLKQAYLLGYEVGYYKHYEAVGWVRKKREELEKIAEDYGLQEEVKKAYDRGKIDGERKKSQDLVQEKKVLVKERHHPVRGLEAISMPQREPKFFHLPKFLRKNQR